MSYTAAVQTLLMADGTLTGLATGGIYLYSALGMEGFSRASGSCAAAWDSTTGILKPSIVVKGRDMIPDGQIHDWYAQYASARQVIEIWMYVDGNGNAATLESMASQVYKLLQDQSTPALPPMHWVTEIEDFRDPTLDNALLLRHDYQVLGARTVG